MTLDINQQRAALDLKWRPTAYLTGLTKEGCAEGVCFLPLRELGSRVLSSRSLLCTRHGRRGGRLEERRQDGSSQPKELGPHVCPKREGPMAVVKYLKTYYEKAVLWGTPKDKRRQISAFSSACAS